MKLCRPVIIVAVALLAIACAQKQAEKAAPTAAEREFAELDSFMAVLEVAVHAIIDSNYTAVRENAAQMSDACRTLEKATLPKFHENVSAQFAEAMPALTLAVDSFATVADSATDVELKGAVNSVRTAFIDVWSVFVPNIKPIEDFHKALQPAWHDYTVNEKWDDLKLCLPDFEEAVMVLDTTTLPSKYNYAQDKFKAGVTNLRAAFDSLVFAFAENRLGDLTDKMTDLHDAFHELQDFYK